MIKRRRNRYKFTEKTQSKKGIAAVVISIVLLAAYFVLIAIAVRSYGALSVYTGGAGVLAILLSVVNSILVFQSRREENSFQTIPHIAAVLNAIAVLCWVGTYVVGIRMM